MMMMMMMMMMFEFCDDGAVRRMRNPEKSSEA